MLKTDKSLRQKEEMIEHMKNSKSGKEKRVENFNQKLAEFPTDINLWLEYIAFQDKIVYDYHSIWIKIIQIHSWKK